jgi:hypothetical protein
MKTKTFLLLIVFLFFGISQISAQTLNKGGVLAISTYKMIFQPNVTMNQFLDFYMNKYIPENDKYYPGTKSFILKGDRGAMKNEVSFATYFESVAVRDKYYPKENDTINSPAVIEAEAKLKPMNDEMNKLIKSATRVYTDWVIK